MCTGTLGQGADGTWNRFLGARDVRGSWSMVSSPNIGGAGCSLLAPGVAFAPDARVDERPAVVVARFETKISVSTQFANASLVSKSVYGSVRGERRATYVHAPANAVSSIPGVMLLATQEDR